MGGKEWINIRENKNGITLISLVISIIVMLILAGVALNAAIGDNGIISQAQYATFLNEMAAVEEAVAMWKINQKENAIPANGLCQEETLSVATNKNAERLNGEVGYYKVWSMSETMPDISVFSSADEFNSKFEAEMLYFPAGVQDLYYLDNEGLGINSKKEYIIDAVNSMVYSTTGITIKGVRVYSAAMAKAVMSGTLDAPLFAEAEVSGTGDGDKLAGNVQEEYLPDGTKNPDYNPNGFQIIGSTESTNIYKLYNDGTLYGKGVKGPSLNTSIEEMNKIDAAKWTKLKIPTEIGEYKKIISGSKNIYIIDAEGYLWSWGNDNTHNRLGLTSEQQVEWTGRTPIKLNVDGKTVDRVYITQENTFVITTDGYLYGCGANNKAQLGLGHTNEVNQFIRIDVDNPNKIVDILSGGNNGSSVLVYNDNTYFATGNAARVLVGDNKTGAYTKFTPILNGWSYKLVNGEYIQDVYDASLDIDQDIKQVVMAGDGLMIVKNDNTLWHIGPQAGYKDDSITNYALMHYTENFGVGVKKVYAFHYGYLLELENGDIWAAGTNYPFLVPEYSASNSGIKLTLPNDLKNSGIKEIFVAGASVYFLSNANEIFASTSTPAEAGISSETAGIIKIKNEVGITTFYSTFDKIQTRIVGNSTWMNGVQLFTDNNNNIYCMGNATVLYGDDILQKTWDIVALDVDKIALGNNGSIAYIGKSDKNLYVAGNDSRMLGIGTSIQEKVNQLIRVDDQKINGKVIDVQFSYNMMYVLTNEGILYGTGIWSTTGLEGWSGDKNPGWAEHENHYDFVKIIENVTMFSANDDGKLCIADGKLYGWGATNMEFLQVNSRVPAEIDLSTILQVSNIDKIVAHRNLSGIITKDGNFYKCGVNHPTAGFGLGINGTSKFALANSTFLGIDSDEKVVDYVYCNMYSGLVLTDKGNVYAWGNKSYIGIGSNSIEGSMPVKVLTGVSQICGGENWFVAIKNDGTVYGTGKNNYGTLGRWIGVDRSQPNSRYKTAFEWVECPELEI